MTNTLRAVAALLLLLTSALAANHGVRRAAGPRPSLVTSPLPHEWMEMEALTSPTFGTGSTTAQLSESTETKIRRQHVCQTFLNRSLSLSPSPSPSPSPSRAMAIIGTDCPIGH